MFKKFFATILVAVMLVGCFSVVASAANYSNWFDPERLNATDVKVDVRDDANREEVAYLIAELCDEEGILPSSRSKDFDDEDDFDSSKSYKMITRLSSLAIVTGYPNGDFGPEDEITRAEALTMIVRTVDTLGIKTKSYNKGSSFSDTEGHWAEHFCTRAYQMDLVDGRGDRKFYPNDYITREEIITILINLVGESNNPLIAAVDTVYGLEFENDYDDDDDDDYRYSSRYDDDDDDDYRYSSRYDDDDDEELTKRPSVNTGNKNNNSSTSSSNKTNSQKPQRPTVNVDEEEDSTSSISRPSVGVDNDTVTSKKPVRPTI